MVLPAIDVAARWKHGLSTTLVFEEGRALGWRGTTILRPARQAGQLPGRGIAVACQPHREPAGGLPSVSAEGLGADSKRRRKTGVPEDVGFKTKPEIALEQIEAACKAGLPRGAVLMDAGYGCNTDLRTGVSALGLSYVAGILPNTSVWPSGMGPLRLKKWSGQGRPPKLIRRDDKHRPISVKQWLSTCQTALGAQSSGGKVDRVALLALCARARSGRTSRLQSHRQSAGRMAVDRVAKGRDAPTKYWLSTLPQNITFRSLVDLTKLRWRIERDYQELKQESAFGHFEGRGWRGFPSPRHAVHRSIRIPGLREGDDSPPLSFSFRRVVPATCRTPRLSTQRLCPCGLNVISPTPSRLCPAINR